MENTGKVLFEDDVPQWYIALGDRWAGPLSATDVYQRVLDQEITWAHYVWRPGQESWKRICDLPTFQAAVPQLPGTSVRTEVKQAAKPVTRQTTRSVVRPSTNLAAKTPPPPGSGEARIWYLYYNDSQFGPFSQEEITRFISIGKIHGKVFCWRDGMAGWERLETVETFNEALSGRGKRPGPAIVQSASKQSKELRGAPRSPLVAKILMASDDSLITAVCRDISVGGMQVLTDRIPGAVGARVKMNVSPSSGAETQAAKKVEAFVAEGVIVRILEDKRGFSFRFERLTDKAKKTIEKYIESVG